MDVQHEMVEKTDIGQMMGDHVSNHSGEHESHNKSLSEGEEILPKGIPYSLHLKRLRIKCHQEITGTLGLVIYVPAVHRGQVGGDGVLTLRHPSHCPRY